MTALEVRTIVGLFRTWSQMEAFTQDGAANLLVKHSVESLGALIARRCKDPSYAEGLAQIIIEHDAHMRLLGEAPAVIGREKKG